MKKRPQLEVTPEGSEKKGERMVGRCGSVVGGITLIPPWDMRARKEEKRYFCNFTVAKKGRNSAQSG